MSTRPGTKSWSFFAHSTVVGSGVGGT
jgi:hypothetical protein